MKISFAVAALAGLVAANAASGAELTRGCEDDKGNRQHSLTYDNDVNDGTAVFSALIPNTPFPSLSENIAANTGSVQHFNLVVQKPRSPAEAAPAEQGFYLSIDPGSTHIVVNLLTHKPAGPEQQARIFCPVPGRAMGLD